MLDERSSKCLSLIGVCICILRTEQGKPKRSTSDVTTFGFGVGYDHWEPIVLFAQKVLARYADVFKVEES